jgi:predicted GNAT family acetyltransferase
MRSVCRNTLLVGAAIVDYRGRAARLTEKKLLSARKAGFIAQEAVLLCHFGDKKYYASQKNHLQ